MGRKPRVEYEGAIYHVIQRGSSKEQVFKRNGDKLFFLEELQEYKRIMDFKLFGYVIMDSHYHLALQTMSSPLQKIMHRVNNRYSKYYNAAHERTGSVFQGRYRAFPVLDESYLLGLLRYIHQNPVKAGACARVQDYPWSSDIFYRSGSHEGNFVDTDLILGIFSPVRERARKEYTAFMGETEKQGEKFFEKTSGIGKEKARVSFMGSSKTASRKSLDEILKDTGLSREDFALVKQGSRKRSLAPYKKAYALKAREERYTMEEIGRSIQLSDTSVYKMLEDNK